MDSSSISEKRKADGEVDDVSSEGSLKKLKAADCIIPINPELLMLTSDDHKDGATMHMKYIDGTELCAFTQKGRLEKGVLGNQSKILIVQLLQRHNKNHYGVYGWNINDLTTPLYGLHFKHRPHIGMNSSGSLMAMTWETKTRLPLTVYDALSGASLYDFPSSHLNMHPSFSFDDANIFTCTSTEFKLWECETKSCKSTMKFAGFRWTTKTISHPSLPLVAMASSQVVVWDYSTEAEVFRKGVAGAYSTRDILFMDENKILLCADRGVELWNFVASVCIFAIQPQMYASTAGFVFDPISNLILAPFTQWTRGCRNDTVIALDPATGAEVNRHANTSRVAGLFCGTQTNILM